MLLTSTYIPRVTTHNFPRTNASDKALSIAAQPKQIPDRATFFGGKSNIPGETLDKNAEEGSKDLSQPPVNASEEPLSASENPHIQQIVQWLKNIAVLRSEMEALLKDIPSESPQAKRKG